MTRSGNQVQLAARAFAVILALLAFPACGALAQSDDNSGPASTNLIAQNPNQLNWNRSLKPAMDEAARSGKLVLVDLYTDWCGWCKKLDRDTYSDPKIIQYINSHFVCARLEAEKEPEGQKLAKELQVRGYPVTIILDPNGKLRGLSYGYFTPQEFPGELSKDSAPKG